MKCITSGFADADDDGADELSRVVDADVAVEEDDESGAASCSGGKGGRVAADDDAVVEEVADAGAMEMEGMPLLLGAMRPSL